MYPYTENKTLKTGILWQQMQHVAPSPKPTLLQHLAVTYVQVPYPASDNSASLYAVSLQKMTLVFLSYICTKFACKHSNLLTIRKENRMGYSSGTNPSEIFM